MASADLSPNNTAPSAPATPPSTMFEQQEASVIARWTVDLQIAAELPRRADGRPGGGPPRAACARRPFAPNPCPGAQRDRPMPTRARRTPDRPCRRRRPSGCSRNADIKAAHRSGLSPLAPRPLEKCPTGPSRRARPLRSQGCHCRGECTTAAPSACRLIPGKNEQHSYDGQGADQQPAGHGYVHALSTRRASVVQTGSESLMPRRPRGE